MPSHIVVQIDGVIGDREDREYEAELNRHLLDKGIKLAEVPRVEHPGTNARWLYAWPDEPEAREFAGQLNKRLKTSHWVVRPLPEGARICRSGDSSRPSREPAPTFRSIDEHLLQSTPQDIRCDGSGSTRPAMGRTWVPW